MRRGHRQAKAWSWVAAAMMVPLAAVAAPSGVTTLHALAGSEGSNPRAELLVADDGSLYGTAWGGGDGTVFRFTRKQAFAVLHAFSGSDGSRPSGPLVWAGSGRSGECSGSAQS
ncbi:MAG TPA: choice-of-anchor tandem repeat GloVer-containing protein, partial [Candidatus Binatia bacterium]|nr:choice-of-anchor tandem repeat GloVer-containing protein [Candidatus Binatia bacterium]